MRYDEFKGLIRILRALRLRDRIGCSRERVIGMSVFLQTFHRPDWNPYRISLKAGALLFLLSLFIHFSIALLAGRHKIFPDIDRLQPQRVDVQLMRRPALDTLQETAKEKPKDAKFESSRNLSANEDTSPERAPTSWAQKRGEMAKPQSSRGAQTKTLSKDTLMSISQKELMEKGELRRESLSGTNGRLDSTGFAEKLKKGSELKISALESDYGQYITRMKRKIEQQWTPHRTVSAKMYSFNEVRVDMAVVLNEQGEIVDLRVINGSFFPDYDSETKRAIRDASPFPNPPKSLIQSDDHLIYMPWTFVLFMNQVGSFHVE